MTNSIEQFRAAILAAGLNPPDEIQGDGKLHRYSTDGLRAKKNGWYFLHLDGVPWGQAGSWDMNGGDPVCHWCAKPESTMTQAERDDFRQQMAAAKQQRQAELIERQQQAAQTAMQRWQAANPATAHPYLSAKGVKPYGVKAEGEALLIPMRDTAGTLHSLQVIDPEGGKRFQPGGRVKGCYHVIGKPDGVLVICEGYATGASIHEATGYAVAVAFNAGNLLEVAQALHQKYPALRLVLAADDDWKTTGNPGITKATEAARAVGGYLTKPDFFGGRPDKATDFNDLHALSGLEAVKAGIDAAVEVAQSSQKVANGGKVFPVLAEAESVEIDPHRNAPSPDTKCLYGLVGEVARAGSQDTEANPYAIAAAFMSYLCVAVGRGAYLPVGDDWHHARLFGLHVGRSGRGRKGTATKLVKRIQTAVGEIDQYLAPKVHDGGLSSREGLALMIHDGFMQGKEEVPPINDKRLWVLESEFANVMHQTSREGNTLSAALRDCWDGGSIKPATKSAPVWATHTHIGMTGNVTPSELLGLLKSRELSNGFANRFLIYWAEQDKINPFPKYTPDSTVQTLAQRVCEVLRFVKADRHVERDWLRVEFSLEARQLYASLYKGELRNFSYGTTVNGLLERRAPMLLRMAMLLALTDLESTIGTRHIEAALAWVRYWVESVRFIFQTAEEEAATAETAKTAQRILEFLVVTGKATRTEITRDCFRGHVSKGVIDSALTELLTAMPPAIEVTEVPRAKGNPGSATKFYKPAANSAKSANCEGNQGAAQKIADSEVCELSELSRCEGEPIPTVRTIRTVRKELKNPQSLVKTDSSHTSHSSHGEAEESEVF